MRRFSFKIDLTQNKNLKKDTNPPAPASPSDGFQMSGDLSDQQSSRNLWAEFQLALERLPEVTGTLEDWDDVNLAAEYVRIYEVSKNKVRVADFGYTDSDKTQSNCFFSEDGTKHLVTRLKAKSQERVSEIRLGQEGQLVRLYYEKSGQGPSQSLDDLFENGLEGLDRDSGRFANFPHYVMRFFLLKVEQDSLVSTFRGLSYFDHDQNDVVTEEAGTI